MVSFVLRGLVVVAACWLLWRLFSALCSARRSRRKFRRDEWTEVLEEIKALPETTDPHLDAYDAHRPRHP